MIRTFSCKKTERLFNRERVREFVNIAVVAQRRLLALNNALALTDLCIPPSNRLEALREDRQGQHSIRINDQYRICLPGKRTDPMMSKLRNTTAKITGRAKLAPIHPGAILKETLDDLGISMNRLSQALHVPANRISAIVAGQRSITGETALRLARYFNTTPDYWINMQTQYELETARDEWDAKILSEVRPRHAA